MDSALWAAKTGLDAQQTRMTVVSNNLANVNTTGFKKDRAIFEDLLYQNDRQVGGATSQDTVAPTGLNIGTGVRVVATEKNHTQGGINTTGNALDVAINGRGFFQVLMPDGSFGYTRDGVVQDERRRRARDLERLSRAARHHHSAGRAEHHHRQRRHGQRADRRPELADHGRDSCSSPTSSTPRACSRAARTSSPKPSASGPAQTSTAGLNGLGFTQQGALEGSNVNVVEELVNMIETQRAYEMNSKAISTTDQMLQYVSQNL